MYMLWMLQKNLEEQKFWLVIFNLLEVSQNQNGEMKIYFSNIRKWAMMKTSIQNGTHILPNGESKNAHFHFLINEIKEN